MSEKVDPFKVLKYIAWCRSQFVPDAAAAEAQDLIDHAKWVICRERSILFKDPIWDNYSSEDILVEYYSILLDINESFREETKAQLIEAKEDDYAWFEKMEKKYLEEMTQKFDKESEGKGEIEDTF